MNDRTAPRSIEQYLAALRVALAGEDPALVQDALYDAEEYLRAEVAANAGGSEADTLELIASTYGAPEEVAEAYRTTEKQVRTALAPPPRKPSRTAFGRFFGVYGDSRTWTALFYMLLALVTGIFYFTMTVTGLSTVRGPARPDHRHPVLPAVRRLHARPRARRGPAGRGTARPAHAAPAAVSLERRADLRAHQGDAGRPPHLDDDVLLPVDAPAWHPLLRDRDRRHLRQPRPHRRLGRDRAARDRHRQRRHLARRQRDHQRPDVRSLHLSCWSAAWCS